MGRMTMIEAIRDAMDCKMAEDQKVVVFGQDVGYFGGVFRCSDGLQQKYGKARCFDTPISETGIIGVSVGMGAYGLRAVAEIQFADREVVEGILEHPGIDAVSFVGSAPVARIVYERAGATGKRVQALGGAKNHMVVLDDAVVPETIKGLIGSAFGAAGQRCMAGSVLVTVGDARERIMGPLIDAARELAVGDGLDESVQVGPVVSCEARDRIVDWIGRGEAAGASVALDGRGAAGGSGGAFVGPTILTGVTPEMDVAREEIFGPVLCEINVATLDDAIRAVNRSRFGNGVSIFTESGAAVRRFRHEVQAGMVGVNIGVAAPVAFFPFSGWKASFLGDLHAHGLDAIDFFTRKKTVTSRFFTSGRESGSYFVEE